MKVLVVEDDAVHRLILKTIFEKSRDEVIAVSNGLEALDALQTNQDIAVILTDIQMPKMDGVELLNWIRAKQQFKSIPVIGFTAGDVGFYRLHTLNSPFNALVPKPLDFRDLHALAKQQVQTSLN
ncbi:response regulator [Algoriphagus namhaensis]